jgi:hypothetical protein
MTTDELTLHEARCCECGKPISSIPSWLADAKVKFECEECRQKHPHHPGVPEPETRRTVPEVEELGDLSEAVEDAGDDEESDEEIGPDDTVEEIEA